MFRQLTKRVDSRLQGFMNPKVRDYWNSPTGPKTIFFYCGIGKWLLVFAGASDMMRPAHALSAKQNTSLAVTGLIWTRYCFVIKPRVYVLAACNFSLSIIGLIQLARIAHYEQTKSKPVVNFFHKCDQDLTAQLPVLVDMINKTAVASDFIEKPRIDESTIAQHIKNQELVVAVKDDKLIGAMTIQNSGRNGDPNRIYTGMLHVSPEFRGTGVARLIGEFGYMFAFWNGKNCTDFDVWAPSDGLPHPQSERNISIYKRGGCRLVGKAPLTEVHPEYKGLERRPCEVQFWESDVGVLNGIKKVVFGIFGINFKL